MGDNSEVVANGEVQSDLLISISRAFRPAAPIDQRDLFAGRNVQIQDVLDVLFQPGQHAVIYGERGVGKTSLTTVMAEIIGGGQLLALRTNCDSTDTFTTIWRKVLDEVGMTERIAGVGFRAELREIARTAASLLPDDSIVTPNDVRRILQLLGNAQTTVVFIDEFDRLADTASRTMFADAIKTLSDHLVPATVVLVGVADDVDELIAEHRSVERALVQIHMPRMSQEELAEIVNRGLGLIQMTIEDAALLRITRLSQGLPHYTHLLAQSAARAAAEQGWRHIAVPEVDTAISRVLDRAQETIINAYHLAIVSPQESLYRQVLCACALAPKDDLGYFAAADIRDPLSAIMGRRYDIPSFARHLSALAESGRGPVLQRTGVARRFRFRFVNPLLQPYVVMRGLASRLIDFEVVERFAR